MYLITSILLYCIIGIAAGVGGVFGSKRVLKPPHISYQIYGYGLVSSFLDISFDFGINKFEKKLFYRSLFYFVFYLKSGFPIDI